MQLLYFLPFLLLLFLLPTSIIAIPTPPQSTSLSLHLSRHRCLPTSSRHNTLNERAPSTHLPCGWTFTLDPTTSFNRLHPAATALNSSYPYALTKLLSPEVDSVSTRMFSLSDGTNQPLFRVGNRYLFPDARVQMLLVW